MESRSRRRGPRTEDQRGEAREQILDAAEALFARGGYNGVSTKVIGRTAGVDPSLLHYYFATKAGLYLAVIARRADYVNTARREALEAYAAEAGDDITVAGVVRAYVKSTFDLARKGDEGYLAYLTVIAQMNSTPAGAVPGMEHTPFDEVVQLFVGLLRRARPAASDPDLYWFYHMLSGAITLSWARTGRIEVLSADQCRSTDFDAIGEHMVAVFSRGLDGP